MKKIKIIKKGAAGEPDERIDATEEKSPVKSNRREAIKTVESWVIDWRARSERETRRAYAELSNLRLRH